MPRRRKTYYRKGKEAPIETLLRAPWWLSMFLAVALFAGIRWVIPPIAANNIILRPIADLLSAMAWLFFGIFFLISLMSYLREKTDAARAAAKASPAEATGWQARVNQYAAQKDLPPLDDQAMADLNAFMARVSGKPKPAEWSLALLRQLEWKRFEDVCRKFYELKGVKAATTPLGPDGGIDIYLYQAGSDMPVSIVQCKAWGERDVGVKLVRELLGVMSHEKIGKGYLMATGGFTDKAKAIAAANNIRLVDGPTLISIIKQMPEADQAALLDFATEGDYTTPTCPSCGIKMRIVSGINGRPDFWGCQNYPRCKQKLGMKGEEQHK